MDLKTVSKPYPTNWLAVGINMFRNSCMVYNHAMQQKLDEDLQTNQIYQTNCHQPVSSYSLGRWKNDTIAPGSLTRDINSHSGLYFHM